MHVCTYVCMHSAVYLYGTQNLQSTVCNTKSTRLLSTSKHGRASRVFFCIRTGGGFALGGATTSLCCKIKIVRSEISAELH